VKLRTDGFRRMKEDEILFDGDRFSQSLLPDAQISEVYGSWEGATVAGIMERYPQIKLYFWHPVLTCKSKPLPLP
jgi:hypothetical protein